MSRRQKETKFVCGVCGRTLDSDAVPDVLAHAENHTPEQKRLAVAATMEMMTRHIDDTIAKWSEYPPDMMDSLMGSKECKFLLSGDAKYQDMLAIRLHCATEFKRVATEYNSLLKARLEMED